MNINITRPIDRKRWLDALHAKGASDERLAFSLDEAERLLKASARPKAVYRLMQRADFHTEGVSIEKHLKGCEQAVVMAVTLGMEVDRLIRRTQVTDMAMAVIIDTGASVLVEQLADEFQEYIKARRKEDDEAMRRAGNAASSACFFTASRFSPGYGDYPVTEQARILRYLDAQRQIGLNVTQDSLMVPRKSITAVMGVSGKAVSGSLATCEECILKDKCELRKEGKFCGDKL